MLPPVIHEEAREGAEGGRHRVVYIRRVRVVGLVALASFACNAAPPVVGPLPRPTASASASASVAPRDPNAPVEIAAGDGFWCALVGGRVRCHGTNDRGQLGGAQTKRGDADVVAIANAASIAANADNACARLADGTVKCWGGR